MFQVTSQPTTFSLSRPAQPADFTTHASHHTFHVSDNTTLYPNTFPLPQDSCFLPGMHTLSHPFTWLPEFSFRSIVGHIVDTVEHDPAFYLQHPLELRMLGSPPNTLDPESQKLHRIFYTHFRRIYNRRVSLWQKYHTALKRNN